MAKKINKPQHTLRSILKKLSLLVVLGIIGVIGYIKVLEYIQIKDQAVVDPIRSLLISSVENLKQPAVIDSKTGDNYFPPEKLYLPYSQNQQPLTYSVSDDASSGNEFTISNKFVMGSLTSKLYSAQNLDKMLLQVPELQACQRGIRVTYQEISEESYILNSSHTLNNGKTVYLYSEKTCSRSNEIADKLKNLQSF